MPELIISGFTAKDITIDLTGKTADQAIKEAIQEVKERDKK